MQTGKSNCFISYNKLGPFSKLATSYWLTDHTVIFSPPHLGLSIGHTGWKQLIQQEVT
jgi:hypothetical protein